MAACAPEYVDGNITEYVLATLGERCPSEWLMYLTSVVYGIILLLGLLGNICTCIVIIANKNMHNPTNYYLFSLAISDILILILGLPMELYIVTDYNYPYRFSEIICKLRAFLVEFTSYASITIICLFSVERWLAICFPLRVKLFSTLSRAYTLIFAAWIVSFLCAIPIAFIVKINKLPLPPFAEDQSWTHLVSADGITVDKTEFCAMDIDSLPRQKGIIYFAFFVFFLFPALVMTVMYGHIAVRLHTADKLLCSENSMNKGSRSRKSVLRVLISVVVTFFLFWFPFHVQRLLSVFLNERQGSASTAVQNIFTLVFYISGYCYYSNSACNPILYNILSENYRRAFCRTILGDRLAKKLIPNYSTVESKSQGIRRPNLEASSLTTCRKQSLVRPVTPSLSDYKKAELEVMISRSARADADMI